MNTNINFNKNKAEWKIENPAHTFREMNLVLPLIQESQIKSKSVISGARKKKEYIFVTFILSKGDSLKIGVLSEYKVHWIKFHNIHTFTRKKILLRKFCCFFN